MKEGEKEHKEEYEEAHEGAEKKHGRARRRV